MSDIPAAMIERLIDAAIYAETAQSMYRSGAHKEVSDARYAIEAEITSLREALSSETAAREKADRERDEAMKAGWNACRRSIYAVCEDVIAENDKHRDDTENPPRHHFGRGGMAAAKSIARGFNSMEAEDDDNLSIALKASDAVPSVAIDGSLSADWIAMTLAEDARIEDGSVANGSYLAVKIASASDGVTARAIADLTCKLEAAAVALEKIKDQPENSSGSSRSYGVGWAFWNVQNIAREAHAALLGKEKS